MHYTRQQPGPYPKVVSAIIDYQGRDFDVDPTLYNGQTPLHVTARSSNQDAAMEVIALLSRHGANMNMDAPDARYSYPILEAASKGNYGIVEIFISGEAFLDVLEGDETILHIAIELEKRQPKLIKLLMGRRAARITGFQKDNSGRTPFDILYTRAHEDFMSEGTLSKRFERSIEIVMKRLNRLSDKGGLVGERYAWLWKLNQAAIEELPD